MILSIVIPCFNVELYVRECIESIIKSYHECTIKLREEWSLEILVINDGSIDNTEKEVLNLLDRHSELSIKYYKKSNGGQSSARNWGLDLATGEYIWFLDSDDFITLDALSLLFDSVKDSDSDMFLFSAIIQNETLNTIPRNLYFRQKSPSNQSPLNYLIDTCKSDAFIAQPCLYVLRKNLLVKNKIKFLKGFIWEDELFTRLCFLYTRKIFVLDESIYVRRFRENSTTQSYYQALHVYSFFYVSRKISKLKYTDSKNHGKTLYEKGIASLKKQNFFSFRIIYYFLINQYSWNFRDLKKLAKYVRKTVF
jgi:glycosyltransferase involved in cell wall biosynthesis